MKFAQYVCVAALVALPGVASAQSASPSVTIEGMNDYRERGISSSGGNVAVRASGVVPIRGGFSADASVATLRESGRHGGADLGIDTGLSYTTQAGPVTLGAGVVGRFHVGARGDMDYGEGFVSAGTLIGPADLNLSASYAPSQDAIGGDNLYLRAGARVGVIGTPFTVVGHVGRSSGDTKDAIYAARLRPGGTYADWSLGAELAQGPLLVGLAYSDTDLGDAPVVSPLDDRRNAGSRVVLKVGFTL